MSFHRNTYFSFLPMNSFKVLSNSFKEMTNIEKLYRIICHNMVPLAKYDSLLYVRVNHISVNVMAYRCTDSLKKVDLLFHRHLVGSVKEQIRDPF